MGIICKTGSKKLISDAKKEEFIYKDILVVLYFILMIAHLNDKSHLMYL